jgi:hypothetical protein
MWGIRRAPTLHPLKTDPHEIGDPVPRYIVERTFRDGLERAIADPQAELRESVVRRNGELGVTWLHSYVSADNTRTFCVYDAPSADAIRATAAANDLPVDRITRVEVLDPYFYGGSAAAGS